MNTLKTALHFRRDVHDERQLVAPGLSTSMIEPWQKTAEDTWSVAAEDTLHATDRLDFVGGVSYDTNSLGIAQEYNTGASVYEYPRGGSSAVNWQFASIFRQSDISEFHASVSSRSRFPTLFERFSTRFGDALPNPDLRPERATNYELGWSGRPLSALQLGGSVFYSDLDVYKRQEQNDLRQEPVSRRRCRPPRALGDAGAARHRRLHRPGLVDGRG